VLFREIFDDNLALMIRIAGDPSRLRPHAKTHKLREVAEIELARGVTKHKYATIAEAEMLAAAGVRDIVLAYNPVGPNIARVAAFVQKYRGVRLGVTADDAAAIAELGRATSAANATVDVLLDLDVGMGRTGVSPGPEAGRLYRQISETASLTAAGIHVYDGHQHQPSLTERTAAVDAEWPKVASFRRELERDGLAVPRIVAGGTSTFPIYAQKSDAGLELSPGTCVFHDAGYGERYRDLAFQPAALLLTRVISRPAADRLTLDLGYKAVASDPPAGSRAVFPDLPEAEHVVHSEEHLVLKTPRASHFKPGDEVWAIPRHICPTTAMHRYVHVVSSGQITAQWEVVARDRVLTL
jgi:D-serine deaminase-like pyridoxal phosphate-dependent protein